MFPKVKLTTHKLNKDGYLHHGGGEKLAYISIAALGTKGDIKISYKE